MSRFPILGIGLLPFFVALLLLGINYRTLPKLGQILNYGSVAAMPLTPEQLLMQLNEQRDSGMISEEAYQAQRADIIRRL